MESLASERAGTSAPARFSLPDSRPDAFQLDFQAPAPAVARSLRLAAGQPATTVTIRFENATHPGVLALTVAVLRPELFRVVVESAAIPAGGRARIQEA